MKRPNSLADARVEKGNGDYRIAELLPKILSRPVGLGLKKGKNQSIMLNLPQTQSKPLAAGWIAEGL
ncbi:MAG: hypothetical protein CM15mP47_3350 [Methanobacteriota archaeon]|nr:MAG: hypothetical protein CM15mP47_3350 [Euryarchaeota archaeon]